ncbi:MAG: histidine kinase [Halieaceae bacterium]|nr:histidine kinase [Halieaceae bacterium]
MTTATPFRSYYYRLLSDSDSFFWILNGLGWLGISVLTYVSLSLPYDQFEMSYQAHNIVQSVLGFMLTLPMRYVFRWVWDWPVTLRMLVGILVPLLLSALWSVMRLQLFIRMTGEEGLWSDFGGWLFPSIFVFLTWAALYHGIKYYRLLQDEKDALLAIETQKRREALTLAQARAEARDAQLRLLRNQLNPHFLFNTLNSVTSLINSGRAPDAKAMVGRLSNFLRFSLEAEGEALVRLSQEIEALKMYLEIEQVRFADRMQLAFEIDPGARDFAVPSLLLQPLVENAVKYAISRSEAGGCIRVTARLVGPRLELCVDDSGSEAGNGQRGDDGSQNGSGIGLRNTRERLENLYHGDYVLDVLPSDLGGLSFRIDIPATQTI